MNKREKMIITINASPKKDGTVGNLLHIFEIAAIQLRIRVKRINLYDYELFSHTGDLKRTPLEYPFIDDIYDSDGIVIGTPTYWFNMPGQLKNFIDLLTDYTDWDEDDVLLEEKLLGVLAVSPGGGATNILENLALTLNTMGVTILPYSLMFFGSRDQPENPNGWGRKHIKQLAERFSEYLE